MPEMQRQGATTESSGISATVVGTPASFHDPVEWLRQEYLNRRKKNPAYSLRAFARSLAMSPAGISQILSRKRPLTRKRIIKVFERLCLPPGERLRLLESFQLNESNLSPAPLREEDYELLADDSYQLIVEWYHFAILSLMETTDFKPDSKWIADRLGISTVEVSSALDRLERLRFIRQVDGKLIKLKGRTRTSTDIASSALRQAHRSFLQATSAKLDEVPLDRRDVSLMTIACDISRLPEAKRRIANFRRSLSEYLESGNSTEVYTISIQLMQLTK
jgi:uncharacterized protein (TIGR02147 family)